MSADPFIAGLIAKGLIKPPAVTVIDRTAPIIPAGDPSGHRYARKALDSECNRVASAAMHTRNDTLSDACGRIGMLVGAGHLSEDEAVRALTAAGLACGLPEREVVNTVRRRIRDGAKTPRSVRLEPVADTPDAYTLDPDAEHDFWMARPIHRHIYDYAKARRAGPWAVLGTVLATITASIEPTMVLPPFVGSEGSLNTFIALVGPSGAGKGAAEGAGHECIRLPEQITRVGVGSGEGILHQYARYVPPKRGEPGYVERVATRVLFSAAEVDQLAALRSRVGSTLLPMLRDAWSGAMLSTAYVDPTKRITLDAHSYRLSLIVGVQPGRAGGLLDDTDGGTPQRFLWLPVLDADAPDQPPVCPKPLSWHMPTLPDADPISGHRVIDVCDEATDEIDRARLDRLRGRGDALDGHLLLCRLKAAAALAALNGALRVGPEDWRMSGLLMDVSTATRSQVAADLAEATRRANAARGRADGERAVLADEVRDEAARHRVVGAIRRALAAGPSPRSQVRKKINSRDRDVFDDALQALLDTGDVIERPAANDGPTGIILQLLAGRS